MLCKTCQFGASAIVPTHSTAQPPPLPPPLFSNSTNQMSTLAAECAGTPVGTVAATQMENNLDGNVMTTTSTNNNGPSTVNRTFSFSPANMIHAVAQQKSAFARVVHRPCASPPDIMQAVTSLQGMGSIMSSPFTATNPFSLPPCNRQTYSNSIVSPAK